MLPLAVFLVLNITGRAPEVEWTTTVKPKRDGDGDVFRFAVRAEERDYELTYSLTECRNLFSFKLMSKCEIVENLNHHSRTMTNSSCFMILKKRKDSKNVDFYISISGSYKFTPFK